MQKRLKLNQGKKSRNKKPNKVKTKKLQEEDSLKDKSSYLNR